jgi:maleamate amidohydrolase
MSELDVYARQNFGNRSGFGTRPALVIVDFCAGFADPAQFGGGNIGQAIAATRPLLAAFRRHSLPVAFTRVVYAEDGSDAGVFALKAPGLLRLTEDSPLTQIVDDLEPVRGEYIVRKQQASAFFGTALREWLTRQGADTVVTAGCTTSGCVRATAVDAMQCNFRSVVAVDCVGDRAIGPHEANLFDLGQKYSDLMTGAEIAAAIERLGVVTARAAE